MDPGVRRDDGVWMATTHIDPQQAATVLRGGGVVAYPTEAVWGLGCDPRNRDAVMRLLALKQRQVGKGLILVAAHAGQFMDFVDTASLPAGRLADVHARWPGPQTWILPAAPDAPRWISGDHDGIAVRVSAHPVVIALCQAFGGALVSTSANPAGAPPPTELSGLEPSLLAAVDGVVAGSTGGLARPTAIRDARSGAVLRD